MFFYVIKHKTNMNNAIKLILSLGGIGVLVWLGYFYKNNAQYDYIEVKRGDIIEVVRSVGKVAVAEEVNLAFQSPGRISDISVKQGDFIEQGAVLARLNSTALEVELKKTDAQIELAKTKMSQLLAGTRSEEIALAEAKVETAKVFLENARQEYENAKIKADNDLVVSYQIAQDQFDSILLVADIAVSTLDSIYQPSNHFQAFFFIENFNKRSDAEWQIIFTRDAHKKIKEDYNNVKKDPFPSNIDRAFSNFKVNLEIFRVALLKTAEALDSAILVSGSKPLEDFKSDVAKARGSINSIQTEILKFEQTISSQKISNQAEVSKAQNLVKIAESHLKSAEDELALKKAKPRDVEIAVYEAQIKDFEASRALLKENIKHTFLTASISGVVKNVLLKRGESAKAGSSAVILTPASNFQIETLVDKWYADKIRMGDRADIFISNSNDENNQKKILGHVVKTNSQAEDDGRFSIVIAFDNSGLNLQFDMQVDLELHSVLKRNVLVVPEDMIRIGDKGAKATLLEDGSKKDIEISIGKKSGGLVEILSGLYEGDRVVK